MESIIASRVIRAGRFLLTCVPWIMAGRTEEWKNSLKKKRGKCSIGVDCTGAVHLEPPVTSCGGGYRPPMLSPG